MTTTFKSTSENQFFRYNHLTGVLIILVKDGCNKGIFTRTDSKAVQLARLFNREQEHGVPSEYRSFDPLTDYEWNFVTDQVIHALNENAL